MCFVEVVINFLQSEGYLASWNLVSKSPFRKALWVQNLLLYLLQLFWQRESFFRLLC